MWRSWRARTGHLFREWSVLRVRMSAQSADLSTVPEKRALVRPGFLSCLEATIDCSPVTVVPASQSAPWRRIPVYGPPVQASPILQAIAQATPPGDMPEKKIVFLGTS